MKLYLGRKSILIAIISFILPWLVNFPFKFYPVREPCKLPPPDICVGIAVMQLFGLQNAFFFMFNWIFYYVISHIILNLAILANQKFKSVATVNNSIPQHPLNQYKIAVIGLTLIILVGIGAFWVGRNTQPPQQFNTSPNTTIPTTSDITQPAQLTDSDKIWVKTDPKQCYSNPWEQDWKETHNNDTSAYHDKKPINIEPEEEEIIKQYFNKTGINVYQLYSQTYQEQGKSQVACRACSCPQGYTLYILIRKNDLLKVSQFGFVTSGKNCLINGEKFLDGQAVPAKKADGCNECICMNGVLGCTKRLCADYRKPTVIPVD